MMRIFYKQPFDDEILGKLLHHHNLNQHPEGGTHDPDFTHSRVTRGVLNHYHIHGTNADVIIGPPATFFETVRSIEDRFNFQLFG
jgi:hypothetical protein